jgi:hypothetical protein
MTAMKIKQPCGHVWILKTNKEKIKTRAADLD